MIIKITSLGLAAFVHGQDGVKLLRFDTEAKEFVFDVDKERDFARDYLNSCCRKHDSNVMALRLYMTKS